MHKEISRLIEYMPDGEKLSSLINAHFVPLLNNNQILLLAYYYLKSLAVLYEECSIYIYIPTFGWPSW